MGDSYGPRPSCGSEGGLLIIKFDAVSTSPSTDLLGERLFVGDLLFDFLNLDLDLDFNPGVSIPPLTKLWPRFAANFMRRW